MPVVQQQLETPAVPSMPVPPREYEESFQNQTNNILKTFFIKLVNSLSVLFGPRGLKYLNAPYGAFEDSTDQTAGNSTTAYAISFNTTDFSNGVTLSNSSRLNVAEAGLYNIQFSIQFKNTTADSQDIDVWFRKNGTDVANSNSRFGIAPRRILGDPSNTIASLNYYISLSANDYIQIMWRVADVGVSIEQYAAGTSPTRPAIPSAIATVSFVSNT